MVDWVHCNKCQLRPTNSSAAGIQITNCGHLFCDKCMDTGKSNQCLVCHIECSSVRISSSMNPDIGFYFQDSAEMLQKYLQVSDFQNTHRIRLFAHISKELQIVQNKYAQAKEHIKKITKNQSSLEKENQSVKDHINKLSRDLAKVQNDNQRLRNFIKMSSGSPSPAGVPPSCRGPLSSAGSNTSLLGRPVLPTPAVNSTSGFIMRGSNTNMGCGSHLRTPIGQTPKPDVPRKQYMPDTQRPQLTSHRLILPRSTQYRTPEQQFNDSTTDRDSSYKGRSNFSLASGAYSLPRYAGNLYASPLNMSGLSLNSKTSMPGRK